MPAAGELRHHGDLVKLAPQPLKVLELLTRRGGDVVTRAEIRDHVWSGDTFVDFEQGLNFCIRQIREALGDTADAPRFIETLPRARLSVPDAGQRGDVRRQPARVTRLIVLPFRMLRPDADTEFLAFSLPDAVTSSLGGLESLVVRSSHGGRSRFAGEPIDPRKIAADADVDVIVSGTLLRAGDDIRVEHAAHRCVGRHAAVGSHRAGGRRATCSSVQDDLTRLHRRVAVAAADHPRAAGAQARHAVEREGLRILPARQPAESAIPSSGAPRAICTERCVEEDPRYAPAWARLGRIRHVMAKYSTAGTQEELDRAEAAFRRALELNPDLPLAHKLYAQLEVDIGRARDAMLRLVERAHTAPTRDASPAS